MDSVTQSVAAAASTIIRGKHQILLGRHRGFYLCVCLECGDFLGATRSEAVTTILDKAHTCSDTDSKRTSLTPGS